MALKEWKKEGHGAELYWVKYPEDKFKHRFSLDIIPKLYPVGLRWIVLVKDIDTSDSKYIINQPHITKTIAIDAAKKYMRTH